MALMIEEIVSLSVSELRENFPAWISENTGAGDTALRATVRAGMGEVLQAVSDEELALTLEGYRTIGAEYGYFGADPIARKLGRAFIAPLAFEPRVDGIEHLRGAMDRGPCLLVSNHLSYADSQFTDQLLSCVDTAGIADRLVFIAGPKVYSDAFRRLAALGLNTLQTAQSGRLSHNDAGLSPREIARIAIATVRKTRALMDDGFLPLLYGEGSRSRSGRLGSFLRGVGRYPDGRTQLIPLALEGTGEAYPIDQDQLLRASVSVRIGAPVLVGNRPPLEAMEEAWHSLAAILSPECQPELGVPATV